jgi:hypothetical protein
MTIRFTTSANEEYLEAIDWYNRQRGGLGEEFALEIEAALRRIVDFPTAWRLVDRDVR